MMSSTSSAFLRLATPLAATLLVVAAGCARKGDAPGTATAPSGPLTMSLQVNPPDAMNRRSAAVKFEAKSPLPDGQLVFEMPAECRVVAGAASRQVRNLGAGPVSQELAFECPPGTAGDLRATFKGADASGKPLEQVVTASLR